MTYYIWQLPLNNQYKFIGYEDDMELSLGDYVMVYIGHSENTNLEYIFYLLNAEHPSDYHAHSLSVSDLIQVQDEDGNSTFYYVDSIGFVKLAIDKRSHKLICQ